MLTTDSITRDEPAYPRDHRYDGHNGFTKREAFALAALQGLCANPGGPFQASNQSGWDLVNCTFEQVAMTAYELADAMLDAAAKGKE